MIEVGVVQIRSLARAESFRRFCFSIAESAWRTDADEGMRPVRDAVQRPCVPGMRSKTAEELRQRTEKPTASGIVPVGGMAEAHAVVPRVMLRR